jgi:thioredoxin-related protein
MLLTQQLFAGAWVTSLQTAQKKAKERNALIFVDLFANWCGWCHKMEQEVFPSETFQKAANDKILLRLNTEDGAEGTHLAQQFSITSLPTFLLLTPDLSIAGVIRGYMPSQPFVQSMADVEMRYKEFRKRVANESSISKDYPKRLELAKEFRSRFAFPQTESRLKKLLAEQAVPVNVRDEAYYELAFTQVLAKKYDESLQTIRKFATVQNKGDAYEKSRLLAGDIYVQQGNWQGAANELRAFKANFPNSSFAHNVDVILPQIEQRLARRQ